MLLPSIVLGWLALRSADEQQIILENRTAALYQKETENAAVAARSLIDDERRAFNETVRQLLAKADPQTLADNFSTELARAWPRKAIGFSLGTTGMLCAPAPQRAKNNPAWEKFLLGNGSFLAGTTPATVYWVSGDELAKPDQLRKSKTGGGELTLNSANSFNAAKPEKPAPLPKDAQTAQTALPQSKAGANLKQMQAFVPKPAAPAKSRATQFDDGKALQKDFEPNVPAAVPQSPAPPVEAKGAAAQEIPKADQVEQGQTLRNVAPQRLTDDTRQAAVSQLTTTTADFRALTTGSNEGVVTRFVQDQLNIIFWLRPAEAPDLLFGCLIEADDLRDLWPKVFPQD